MSNTPSAFVRLMNKRSRNGQSLIIVALAFVGLIAFVGIAVDVALLFVRYSTLRRAVDAAAIAAAGQIREGVDFLTLQAVAEQYVGLSGIKADNVRVDTCQTEIAEWLREPTNVGKTGDDAMQALLSKVPPSELCKSPPQKLVRVSAQIYSDTTFLRVVGWNSVLLEASSVSQTAVLDVALLIDTSSSESFGTKFAEIPANYPAGPSDLKNFRQYIDLLKNPGNPDRLQPYVDAAGGAPNYSGKTASGQPSIRWECWNNVNYSATYPANYAWGGCCNDPTTQSNPDGTEPKRQINNTPDSTYPTDTSGNIIWLSGQPPQTYPIDWYLYDAPGLSSALIMADGVNPYTGQTAATVKSGVPDGNFSDLVCQPFKDVRDAARRFIKRLDFVRGDRLMMVSFNADIKQIIPANSTIPVMTDKDTAIRALNEKVGVSLGTGSRQDPFCITNSDSVQGTNGRGVDSYWTDVQCADTNTGGALRMGRASLTNPAWIRREAVWVMVLFSDGFANRTPSYTDISAEFPIQGPPRDSLLVPSKYQSLPAGYTIDDLCSKAGTAYTGTLTKPDGTAYITVDELPLWGFYPHLCVPPLWQGGTRAPWGQYSSVKLGAGDQGSPIYSFGFCPWWTICNPSGDPALKGPIENEYCTEMNPAPYWVADRSSWTETEAPYCADNDPDTRHFCSDATGVINPQEGTAYCDPHYDADDYARDQADFAGLIDYTSKTKGSFIAMFSIFFFNPRPDPANPTAQPALGANILGVYLLRYIADAGDNGQIDDRLQQWYRAEREQFVNATPPNLKPPLPFTDGLARIASISGDTRWDTIKDSKGTPIIFSSMPITDPCEPYSYRQNGYPAYNSQQYIDLYRTDCGQFFFADNINKVSSAFTEIAGRLFTRLSR